jgi:methyl-accepting chemotaxis protein
MNLSNLRIGTRLAGAFGLVLALMVALAAGGWSGMSTAQFELENIVHDNVHKTELLTEMSEQVHIVSRVQRSAVMLDDAAQIEAEVRKVAQAREKYAQDWTALQKHPASAEGAAIRERMEAARRVSEVLGRISSASTGQIANVAQIGEAVSVFPVSAQPA